MRRAGIAAPAVVAFMGVLGASAAATAAVTSTAIIYGLFGTSGAGLAGYKMNRRMKELKGWKHNIIFWFVDFFLDNSQQKNCIVLYCLFVLFCFRV
jgi:hypothetical protein